MLSGTTKKIELAANLAIILVACLLGIVLVKTYLVTSSGEQVATSQGESQLASAPTLTSLDINWKANGQTLVLAVSSNCHFCTESAPFYKKLGQSNGSTRLVVVLPQPVGDGRKYLEKLGVSVDEIKQFSLQQLGVNGTPTLLLVDASGKVKNVWVGKLSPEQELAVLNML